MSHISQYIIIVTVIFPITNVITVAATTPTIIICYHYNPSSSTSLLLPSTTVAYYFHIDRRHHHPPSSPLPLQPPLVHFITIISHMYSNDSRYTLNFVLECPYLAKQENTLILENKFSSCQILLL